MNVKRDGVIKCDGLRADFRFLRPHHENDEMAWIETSTGETWVPTSRLKWDTNRTENWRIGLGAAGAQTQSSKRKGDYEQKAIIETERRVGDSI